MLKKIEKCRICGNRNLVGILDLGVQALTGVFPEKKEQKVETAPLELVKCEDRKDGSACGLVQLCHSFDLDQLYGGNYGYRSGLNPSMVAHLNEKVGKILKVVPLFPGDLVLDIGSNDSTLLQAYPENGATLVGIDPTALKFRKFYPEHISYIADFFPSAEFRKKYGDKKAKIITSISMFYDLEDPMSFAGSVYDALSADGIWVFEQSYMPAMIAKLSYDTVCHEHLEYYALTQIKWMLDRTGFKIIDVEFNEINGGSFSVTACRKDSKYRENSGQVSEILNKEKKYGIDSLIPFQSFRKKILSHRDALRAFLDKMKKENNLVLGYGASTKGNVLLQYCGITSGLLPAIGEVNRDKFGHYTPGTLIPIIPEKEAKEKNPYCFMVLPWHFREFILKKEKSYLDRGGRFLFPLPEMEIV